MSTIDSVIPEHLRQETAVAGAAKKNELGQDEFLKLMLAQLEHQDPFKPMENGEFVAQMAQFSTVAGIENMDKSLNGMSEAYAGNQLLQASTLIGRTALVPGNDVNLANDAGVDAYYQLPNSTSGVTVDIYDSAGALVHHSEQSSQSAGIHKVHWDGLLTDGSRAPMGSYTLSVNYGQADQLTQASVLIENKITSVALIPGSTDFTFETEQGNTVALKDIKKLQ